MQLLTCLFFYSCLIEQLILKPLGSVLNIIKFMSWQACIFKLQAISRRQFTFRAAQWCVSWVIKDLTVWGCQAKLSEEEAWGDLKKEESPWETVYWEKTLFPDKQQKHPGAHPGKQGIYVWNPLLSTDKSIRKCFTSQDRRLRRNQVFT